MNYATNKKLTLENMENMTIDEIVELYRNGSIVETYQDKYSPEYLQTEPTVSYIIMDTPVPFILLMTIVGATLGFSIGRSTGREDMITKVKSIPTCSSDCIARL